ncbi:MAG TPA: hypothetical protein VE734_06495 [Terriglobales bacterium]|jgi:archaellum component FlaC|nr:hypothetical protein [Terriglobales bacterium]
MSDIDERLDRLTERHEALSQSIQLLTADVHALQEAAKMTMNAAASLLETTTNLTRIVESHERRITRLEGRQE